MTLEEASKVAEQGLPVIYRDISYMRIDMIGYKYERGRRYPFVRLRDWNANSFTEASPYLCQVDRSVSENG